MTSENNSLFDYDKAFLIGFFFIVCKTKKRGLGRMPSGLNVDFAAGSANSQTENKNAKHYINNPPEPNLANLISPHQQTANLNVLFFGADYLFI